MVANQKKREEDLLPPHVPLPELPFMAVSLHFTAVARRSFGETKRWPSLSCLVSLSPTKPFSLSLPSHSLSKSLSLSLPWLPVRDPSNQQPLMSARWWRSFSGCWIGGEAVPRLSNCRRWWGCTTRGRPREEWQQNAISGHPHHCLWVQINSPWHPLHNGTLHLRRKRPYWWHAFLYKLAKLWRLIWAKRSLFLRWWSRIVNRGEKWFLTIYNMPMFEVVCKNSCFSRKTVENVSLTMPLLRAGPTGTQNQNLRSLLNLFWCQEFNGGLKFGEQTSIENHVSRGKLNRLDLSKLSITWYLGLCFGNRAYPWIRVDEYGLIMNLNNCFDWQVKTWHFGRFCPRVRNLELKLKSNYEHMESMVRLI